MGHGRRQQNAVAAHQGGHVPERAGQVERAHGLAGVVGDEFLHLGGQRLPVESRRHAPQAHDLFRERLGVARGHGEKRVFQGAARALVDAPDHAAVEQPQPVAGQDQEVARVRVGVEEIVAKDHLQKDVRRVFGQARAARGLLGRGRRGGERGHGLPVELLHGEHAPGALARERARENHARVAAEIGGEVAQVAFLAREIELAQDGAAHFRGHGQGLVQAQLHDAALGELGQSHGDVEVRAHVLLDARVLYLDHHARPVGERRPVHLADGGRGDGRFLEGAEMRLRGRAEFGLDGGAHDARRVRGGVVAQFGQFRRGLRADEVRARGQNLPDLDGRGPEFGHGQAQPRLARQSRQRRPGRPFEMVAEKGRIRGGKEFGQAVLGQNAGDFREPPGVSGQMRDGGQGEHAPRA
ncbi:hypothetical protein DSECCO2_661410 [anaerobic digester metagenome]